MRQGTAYREYRQRDWSWTKSHIATLWDSLFKGHPIGLCTFWVQPTPEGRHVHKLIVDGQRRLLSIYTAMENTRPPTILPNTPAPPLGLHVNVLTGNFRFHTPMMNRRPQWMAVCDIIRDAARLVLAQLLGRFPRLQLIWADGAYGGKLVEWARTVGGWTLELVRRPAQQHTFQVLPRRWVVERTFGWLNRQRRLSKDDEALCETTETRIHIFMTGILLRRLAHLWPLAAQAA